MELDEFVLELDELELDVQGGSNPLEFWLKVAESS